MNIYRISQNSNNNYDTYDSAVVAAQSEEDARTLHPSGDPEDWRRAREYGCSTWVKDPEDVTAVLLGVACPGTEAGVLLASFNAG